MYRNALIFGVVGALGLYTLNAYTSRPRPVRFNQIPILSQKENPAVFLSTPMTRIVGRKSEVRFLLVNQGTQPTGDLKLTLRATQGSKSTLLTYPLPTLTPRSARSTSLTVNPALRQARIDTVALAAVP